MSEGIVEPVTLPIAKFATLSLMKLAGLFRRLLSRMPVVKSFTIHCEWDEEAKVWYVSDSDVPGLTGEASTVEEMNELLRVRIPELLAANCQSKLGNEREVPWQLVARRQDRAALAF